MHSAANLIRTRTAAACLAALLFLSCFCPAWPAWAAEFETWETDNGLRVLFAPAPTLPMLDVRLIFDAGSARDNGHEGLARMTNLALTFGTRELDADATADRFESVGAEFSVNTMRDTAMISLRTLTEPDWMEIALATLTEILAGPAFPEEDLARARRQTLQAIQRERQEPGAMASRRFFQLAYGDHPYASHPLGREESVPGLDREAVRDFFLRHYTAANAVLAMTGDLTLEAAREASRRIAEALPQGERLPELPAAPLRTRPVLEHIPFASEQAHIFMGAPLLRRGDPDRFALTVANHAFGGGGFTSRLFQDVRTDRGLAYSIGSRIQPMAAEGPFLITMQTGVDQAENAVNVLRKSLKDFVENGITGEELAASQANLVGRFPLGLASNSDIAATLGVIGFYGLGPDYLAAYTDRVGQVTLEDIQGALQNRLSPLGMVTVIVGGPESMFVYP